MYRTLLIAILASLSSFSALAQSAEKGMAICYEIEKIVNAVVDYTRTSCVPAGGKAGALSFILISSKPVFSVSASKKGWLIVTVGAVGKMLNGRSSLRTDELWVADSNLMKNHTAYVLPTTLVKSLQSRIYNDQIDLDRMYSELENGMVRKLVERKK